MVKQIVILHGWQQKLDCWQPLVRELSKNYQVFLPFMPGFGTNRLIKTYNLNDYINWLADYLKKEKINHPYLIGYSFGGRVAIRFTSHHHKIQKLILMDAAGIKEKNNYYLSLWWLLAKIGKIIFNLPLIQNLKSKATWLLYKMIGAKDYYLADPLLKETMKKILAEDQRQDLPKINVPTLILWGGQDKSTPVKFAYYMKEKINKAQLKVFDNANHALPFIDPKSISIAINNFINND